MLHKIFDGLKFAAQVGAIVIISKSLAFAHNYIPSESMVPTLEVGDRLFTDKSAYGWSRYSLMFDLGRSLGGTHGRIAMKVPARGDVVTFVHPKTGETFIKRVIGLPEDKIALLEGSLFINGELVPRRFESTYTYREYQGEPLTVTRYTEELPGGINHAIIEVTDNGFADNMDEVTVPADSLFVMGDNRDNSGDSRFEQLGFVPIENLLGKARLISFSAYGCETETGLVCATREWFSKIR